jgi:hypothetical protein
MFYFHYMHHFYDINVSAMLILLAACVQDGGWRSHFNNYCIITHIVLPNSEPYNKLFTTTEDGQFMAETRMIYK